MAPLSSLARGETRIGVADKPATEFGSNTDDRSAMGEDRVLAMYARAIDEAALRLDELRHEEWEDLGLAAVALAVSIVATQVYPPLALPLFLGGVVGWFCGLKALVGRWNLVERLAGEKDAYVLPEVFERAMRETTIERRRSFAALIRMRLKDPELAVPQFGPAVEELRALVSDLEDEELALKPAAAVSCLRLLSEREESPLLNSELPAELLRLRLLQIRSGFFEAQVP